MDRVIVQVGALPQDTDILNTNLFALINDGFKNQALLGSTTVVAGLAVTPTTPTASLQVNVAPGVIFQMDEIDASAYGSLGSNTNNIMKQGILSTAQVLSITPPTTSGYSQVFLVEAILNDVDGGQEVESYYNSANPSQPYSGPANSGASNYTIRECNCVVALKAGTPASTGTQVAPTVDAGYVPLFTITVSNGQTQITSGNIAQVAAAPFFPTIPQIPYQVQQGVYNYAGTDTGTANNYAVSFVAGQPIPAAYTVGMEVSFKAVHANTGASVVNVNGLGNVTIQRASGVALSSGDIVSGQMLVLRYDGTYFQMVNYLGAGATSNTTTAVDIPYVADSGAQNAIVATFSPAITSGLQVAGLYIAVKLAYAITGACTINVNGLGVKSVTLGDGTNPPYNAFVAGEIILLVYDGTKYQISGTSAAMFYLKPTANYNLYVNTSTGSDTLYDGTSASVVGGTSSAGPFKTIGRAILAAWSYAPSQYTITINVASGTYNENVATPSYAGPNVIINGASASSVTVSGGSGHAIQVTGPNTLTVNNVTVQTSGGLAGGFVAGSGGALVTNNCASNGIAGGVFYASSNANIKPGNHTFNGSATYLYWSIASSTISLSGVTHTFSGSISVSASAAAESGGSVSTQPTSPVSYVNPSYVSGAKYIADYNGFVGADTLGYSFYPGSSGGSTSNGGQYEP